MKLIQTRSTPLSHRPGRRSATSFDDSALRPEHSMEEAARSQGDHLLMQEWTSFSPVTRLVVLIPEGSLDDDALVNKVWKLASAFFLPLLFLGEVSDPDYLPFMRRRLAILAARTNYGSIKAGSSILVGTNWEQAVKETLLPGDLLVCLAELKVPALIFGHEKLGEALSKKFAVPVYMLEGLEVDLPPHRLERVKSFLSLFLTFAAIIAFGGFQIWIDQETSSWLTTVVICLSVVIEIVTILKINEWIG